MHSFNEYEMSRLTNFAELIRAHKLEESVRKVHDDSAGRCNGLVQLLFGGRVIAFPDATASSKSPFSLSVYGLKPM